MDLPLLTVNLPGTGGIVRARPEDFLVEEVPLYLPLGVGDHCYALIEKTGITTREAIRRLAGHAGVPESAVGSAGLKDARAVARQTLSIEHVEPRRLEGLELPNLRVLSVKRHRNKLKTGHLIGNRFVLRIRDTVPGALEAARAILEVLEARGLPNAFGPQRFGTRGDTHLVGRAMLQGDAEEALALILGRPSNLERDPKVVEARHRYDAGELDRALDVLPRSFSVERRVLSRLLGGTPPERALGTIPKALRRLYVSAWQSHLFNQVLADRLPDLDRLQDGDLAFIHAKGAVFTVEDAAEEQPRCDAGEISPSGPLFGRKMKSPDGRPGEREAAVLEATGMTPADFKVPGIGRMDGARRPLRVPLEEVAVEAEEDALVLRFRLPKGSYATAVLAEVQKTADLPHVEA